MGLDDSGIIRCAFQYLQYKYGKRDTCHAGYGSQYHTFRKDLLQNIFGTGTDGTPYAYFRSAFLYRYHHDIGYADSSGKQGSQAHHPDKDAGTCHQCVHHGKHGFCIEEHDCLFVVRRDVMGGFDAMFYFRFYVLNLHSRLHDKTDYIYPLSQIICLLHRCEG